MNLQAIKKCVAGEAADAKAGEQIRSLSFNLNGHAFRHPEEFTDGPIYLNARGTSSTTLASAMKKNAGSRLSISLTEEEKAPSATEGLSRYLLVGFVLTSTNIPASPPSGRKQGQAVGIWEPKEDEVVTWDPKDQTSMPHLAVVEVANDDKGDSTRTYALHGQNEGICTPYTVKQSQVFYLSIFRDLTKARHPRGANWNKLVSKFAVQQGAEKVDKQLKLQRARDHTKLTMHPTMSFKNEILTLVGAYYKSRNPWFMKELLKVLESPDSNLYFVPPANTTMRLFADLGSEDAEDFTEDQATLMVEEMASAWEDMPKVDAKHLWLLGIGVRSAGLAFDYAHLRPFVQEGIHQLLVKIDGGDIDIDRLRADSEPELTVKNLAELVRSVHATVERFLGYVRHTSSVRSSEEAMLLLLRAIKEKLKEAIISYNESGNMVEDAAGDPALEYNYQDVWAKYGDRVDANAIPAIVMESLRMMAAAHRQKEAHSGKVAERIVEILEKAGI